MARSKGQNQTQRTGAAESTKKSSGAASKPRKPAADRGTNGTRRTKRRSPAALAHEAIALRAYEIWLAKGRPHGQDFENWREAEADLLTDQR